MVWFIDIGTQLSLQGDNASLKKQLKEKDERIEKLEELLKECYKMLAQYHIENSEPTLGENIQLLTKIEEVLK